MKYRELTKRAIALLLCVVMLVSALPMAALAETTDDNLTDGEDKTVLQSVENPTPEATATPGATPVPSATPEATPTATPEATPTPTATPEVTPAPSSVPEESPTPTATPEATATPAATPEATPAVSPSPMPSAVPENLDQNSAPLTVTLEDEIDVTVTGAPAGAKLTVNWAEPSDYEAAIQAAVGDFYEICPLDISVTQANGAALNAPVTIKVAYDNFGISEAFPDGTVLYHVKNGTANAVRYTKSGSTISFSAQNFSPFVFAAPMNSGNGGSNQDRTTYTVTIQYLKDETREKAAEPVTRTVEIGTAFQEDIISPAIDHFEADNTVVKVDLPDTQIEDVTYTVLYKQTEKTIATDYIAGNANVSKLTLVSADGSYEVQNRATAVLLLRTGLELEDNSDYLGFNNADVTYRFRIPRHLQSGGVLEYADYSFLTGVKREVVTVDGVEYIQLTGVNNIHSNTAQAIPAEIRDNLGIKVISGVNNDSFKVYGEAWLTKDGETKKLLDISPEFYVKATLENQYDLTEHWDGSLKASGYYNPDTHAYYPTAAAKAAAMDEGAVYGRFFAYQSIVMPVGRNIDTPGLEFMRKATFDVNYRLEIKDPAGTRYETGEYRPILVDAYVYDVDYGENSKQGFVYKKDATVGGNINPTMGSYHTSVSSGPHTYMGIDTRTAEGGKLSVTAVYDEGTPCVNIAELFFVPTTNYPEDTSWTLHINHDNLGIEGMSGNVLEPNADATPDPAHSNNYCDLLVARKTNGGIPGMNQKFKTEYSVIGINTSFTVTGRVEIPKQDYNDYEITAANVFIKADTAGLEITGGTPSTAFGASSKKQVLYACKEDGTGWASESEMFTTEKKNLVFYSSLADAQAHGTVVAALFTYRDGLLKTENIDSKLELKATSMDRTYACILESEIWSDDNINTTDYSDFNDVKLTDPPPSNAIYFKNAGYNYKKVQWNGATAVPQDSNKAKYGHTVLAMGYSMVYSSGGVVMNGRNPAAIPIASSSNRSTFNISEGERTVAAASTMVIQWTGNGEDPKIPLDFSISSFYSDYWSKVTDPTLQHVGKTYLAPLDAVVTWNKDTEEFESSDPRFGEIDPAHFTVEGAGNYTIYHTLHIGDEKDLSMDAAPGAYNWKYLRVKQYGDCGAYVTISNGGDQSIMPVNVTVTTTAIVSLVKSHIAPFIAPAPDTEFGFTMVGNSMKVPTEGYKMLDILPYNGDGRGTDMKGSYHLKDNQVNVVFSSSNDVITSTMEMYYTTDPAVRGKGDAASMDAFTTNALGVSWQKMTESDVTEGNVKRKEITYLVSEGAVPTAIAYVGDMGTDNQFYITMQFVADGAVNGSVYCNNATIDAPGLSTHPITSGTAKTEFIRKEITGVVWIDNNRDGIRQDGEDALPDVKLELYKADGTQVAADGFGASYSTVVSAADGSYSFTDFPDSSDTDADNQWLVRALLTEEQMKLYEPTLYQVAGEGQTGSDVKLVNLGTPAGTSLMAAAQPGDTVQTELFPMMTYGTQKIDGTKKVVAVKNVGLAPKAALHYELIPDARYGTPEVNAMPEGVTEITYNSIVGDATVAKKDITMGAVPTTTQKTAIDSQFKDNGNIPGTWSITGWYDNQACEDTPVHSVTMNGNKVLYAKCVFTPDVGSLTISKTVSGNAGDQTKEFDFVVTLTNGDNSISGEYNATGVDGGKVNFDASRGAAITLKHGQSVTISGIPAGFAYTVTETDANKNGYVTTMRDASGSTSTGKDAIVKDETQTVVFTNTRDTFGDLTVTKTVAGNAGDTSKDFSFTVTLKDGNNQAVSGTFGGITFTNGSATFTLKHNETKSFTDIPNGTTYTVTEASYTADGYTTTKTGDSGTIEGGKVKNAVFINTKDTPPTPTLTYGNLTVSKVVAGNAASTTKAFTFTVTLNDTSISATYGDMTFSGGKATFTLKHGESKTAKGLPSGLAYTVTESDNTGYTVTSTGATGNIVANSTVTAAFTNTRNDYGYGVIPKTGDLNSTLGWVLAVLAAAAVMVVTILSGKKKYSGKYTK